ncbi:PDZ domain-containing protein 8-like isoform X2 [Pollicipes pollicipes]|uniref:PDZ domain-containing protein 8-like isoform X2 n=1 Tax=Pollicipes pollicipes TaxID=41117 RepID=UPI0018855B7D|nr:PDZ domain-containing protein 8-like isoform X2 [Pollicipes pollicipes]
MIGTLLLALLCVLLGVVLTLAVQYYVLENYFESLPIVGPTDKPTVTQPKLPEELADEVRKETYQRKETCLAINLLVQMLFGDLVHTPRLRQWVLNKIHLEFQELMARTSVGKLFHNIRINELDLGGQMPVFKSVTTQYVSLHPVTQTIEQLDLKLDVEYNGGLKISILADIVLNRKGFVFLKIERLSGQVLLRFTRRPFSHWAYSFIGDPTIEVEAESQFQGRPQPRITAVIVRQIKRTLRKRHTLPNYKLRYKPFFMSRLQQLVPDATLAELTSSAQLEVTVKRLSRLRSSGQLTHVYCRLAVGADPLLLDTSHISWHQEELHVPAHPGQAVGLLVRDTFVMEKQRNCITIFIVVHNAPAYKAGLKAGDIVDSVDGEPVRDLPTANRLLRQPASDIRVRVLRMAENKEAKHSSKRPSVGGSRPPAPASERRLHSSASESLLLDESPVRRRRGTKSVSVGLPSVADKDDNSSAVSLPAALHSCLFDQEKSTKWARWNEDPVLNETFQFSVGPPHRYLNVSVMGVPETGAGEPAAEPGQHVLLGRLSLPLAQLVSRCQLTVMGHHVETCRFLPPTIAAVKDVDHELSVFNGFEPTYCFGDVLLSFVLTAGAPDGGEPEPAADEDGSRLLERMDVDDSEPDEEETPLEIRVGHRFARMKFTASTECDFCHRKIWLKDAFQCSACLMTCHKRCIDRCQSQTTCQAELNRGWRDSISDSHLPEIVTSSEDTDQPADKKTAGRARRKVKKVLNAARAVRQRRRRLNNLIASLSSSGLKRTGSAQNLAPPAPSLQRGLSTSLPPSPQRSPATSRKNSLAAAPFAAVTGAAECDSDEELDVALSNMQRCANNENLVLAARELGCQLYVEMEPAARRDRLENMVSKLQTELDAEESRRQELLQADRQAEQPSTRTRCALLLAQSDEKTKMLGILMVYYNAGLRDAEQSARSGGAVQQ